MDQVFNHDLDGHRHMASRANTAHPPTEREIKEHNQGCVTSYGAIRTLYLQRKGWARPKLDPARPSQPFLESVRSPSNTSSATQAEHPAHIQTKAMPSEALAASPRPGTLPAPPRSRPPLTRPPMPAYHHQPSTTLQRPMFRLNRQNRREPVNAILRSASQNASVPQIPGQTRLAVARPCTPTLLDKARRCYSTRPAGYHLHDP